MSDFVRTYLSETLRAVQALDEEWLEAQMASSAGPALERRLAAAAVCVAT